MNSEGVSVSDGLCVLTGVTTRTPPYPAPPRLLALVRIHMTAVCCCSQALCHALSSPAILGFLQFLLSKRVGGGLGHAY